MADERGENLNNVVQEARVRVVAVDEIVFRAVADYHSPTLDRVLPDLSLAASYSRIWIGLSGLLVALGGKRGRIAAAEGLLSVAITSFLANLVLKRAVPRQRPKEPVPEARELPDPESSSFPSGHTASGAAYSSAVGHVVPQLRVPLNALAAVIGFSRVYTGVHHPSDVAVGWVLGKGVAALVRRSHVVPKLMSRLED
ncbi:MAG: phosphatase PAP2 family protein [Acidimicrobiia bacterium]